MPGHVVHIEVARTFLAALSDSETQRWTGEPEIINALFHGALDPDMGLFPGGDSRITDLSHHAKTADLVRNLVELARDQVETAYAWGWLTHFIADTHLHPAINRACGEHLHGSATKVTWDDSPGVHMRVELGLDSIRLVKDEGLGTIRLREFLDRRRVSFLQEAFAKTHEILFDARSLVLGHRVLRRAQRAWFSLEDSVGRDHLGRSRRPRDYGFLALYHPARVIGGLLSAESIPYLITHSLRPPGWLEEAVDTALIELPDVFSQLLDGGLADLPNLNLDTGRPLET